MNIYIGADTIARAILWTTVFVALADEWWAVRQRKWRLATTLAFLALINGAAALFLVR